MKTVILAGGLGTRLAEYTDRIPKPMVQLGTKPILSHIMNFYQSYGYDDFIIAAGYKKEIINEYYKDSKEFKNLKIVDTGKDTMTGGRLLRLKSYIKEDEDFFMTYGDGLCAINLDDLKKFHENHKKVATVTAVHPPVRFGELEIIGDYVVEFEEKPQAKAGWINGGYFVFEPGFFKYLENDETILERKPLETLAEKKQLMAFKHNGFWQCVDTRRDRDNLEKILQKK